MIDASLRNCSSAYFIQRQLAVSPVDDDQLVTRGYCQVHLIAIIQLPQRKRARFGGQIECFRLCSERAFRSFKDQCLRSVLPVDRDYYVIQAVSTIYLSSDECRDRSRQSYPPCFPKSASSISGQQIKRIARARSRYDIPVPIAIEVPGA